MNNLLFTGTLDKKVPIISLLFEGTVPVNNLLFTGTLSKISPCKLFACYLERHFPKMTTVNYSLYVRTVPLNNLLFSGKLYKNGPCQ